MFPFSKRQNLPAAIPSEESEENVVDNNDISQGETIVAPTETNEDHTQTQHADHLDDDDDDDRSTEKPVDDQLANNGIVNCVKSIDASKPSSINSSQKEMEKELRVSDLRSESDGITIVEAVTNETPLNQSNQKSTVLCTEEDAADASAAKGKYGNKNGGTLIAPKEPIVGLSDIATIKSEYVAEVPSAAQKDHKSDFTLSYNPSMIERGFTDNKPDEDKASDGDGNIHQTTPPAGEEKKKGEWEMSIGQQHEISEIYIENTNNPSCNAFRKLYHSVSFGWVLLAIVFLMLIGYCSEEIEKRGQEISRLRSEADALISNNYKHKVDNNSLQRDVQGLQEIRDENSSLKEEIVRLKTEYSKEMKKKDQEMFQLLAKVDALKFNNDKQNLEKNSLQKDVQGLQEVRTESSKEMKKKDQEISQLRADADALRSDNYKEKLEKNSLKEEIVRLKSESASALQQVKTACDASKQKLRAQHAEKIRDILVECAEKVNSSTETNYVDMAWRLVSTAKLVADMSCYWTGQCSTDDGKKAA